MQNSAFHKTRMAPTPSGYLHLGNAYSFLLTKEIAERTGAKILLRIDDLDAQRLRKEYAEDIFETLSFLEINYDEGPKNYSEYEDAFSQQHRQHLYAAAFTQLADSNLVFACSCSRSDLEKDSCNCVNKNIPLTETGIAWRLKTRTETVSVKTFDKGNIPAALPGEMKNFIVRKKDGDPSYQLASLIDDVHFGIDLVVRGEDLWNSTLAQLYLAEKLNISSFAATVFFHHPLFRDEKGNKLSKSAGSLSVKELIKNGLGREDILQMAATNHPK